jgi:sigma-B regulation protein RsbU (phosphoserine phosphatase)
VIRLDEGGPVMGLLPGARYIQAEVRVEEGDLLVVYSDGILEAENARGDEFGEEGVIATIAKHANTAPGEICAAVLEDVRLFLAGAPPQDDQTLLIARLDRVGSGFAGRPLSAAAGIRASR